jgi:hypothetical protein
MTTPSSIRTERLAMPASNRSIPFLPVPSSPSRTLRYRRGVAPFLLGAAAALTLSACGTSGTPTVSPSGTPAASPSAAAAGGSPARAAARGPAASGLIAAVSGSTMQVQNAQVGQVAVAWTAATKFTQQVTLSLGSIKAGDCVTAAATAGSPTAASFTATAVTVSQAVNGRCFGGLGGFGGFGGGGAPSPGASFSPRPRPSGTRSFARPSGAARTGAFATGSVVSVSGSTIVVASRSFGAGASASPAASASPTASAGTTTNKTVTLTSATKITTVRSATAAAATVGRCVTAQGKADSTGTVAATVIAVTDPVNGKCTSGFGGFGTGGRGGQAAATGGTSA